MVCNFSFGFLLTLMVFFQSSTYPSEGRRRHGMRDRHMYADQVSNSRARSLLDGVAESVDDLEERKKVIAERAMLENTNSIDIIARTFETYRENCSELRDAMQYSKTIDRLNSIVDKLEKIYSEQRGILDKIKGLEDSVSRLQENTVRISEKMEQMDEAPTEIPLPTLPPSPRYGPNLPPRPPPSPNQYPVRPLPPPSPNHGSHVSFRHEGLNMESQALGNVHSGDIHYSASLGNAHDTVANQKTMREEDWRSKAASNLLRNQNLG